MNKLVLAFVSVSVMAVTASALGADPVPETPAVKTSKNKPAAESADEAAIRQSAVAFREAFNKADAKAISALWTTDGDYIDESGQRFQGREAIEEEYARFFAAAPGVKINILVDSVKIVGGQTAIEDGRSTLDPAPEGAPAVSRYTAIHVKADGKWLISNVRESRVEISSVYHHLRELEAMIGSWSADEHDIKMNVNCRWLANKNFIERRYTVQQAGQEASSGLQLIGWDPLERRIQSWTFSSDGGHAIGIWSPKENGWAVASKNILADGTIATSVNLVTFIDRDAVAWQSVDRTAGGSRLPDLDEILLKRVVKTP